MATFSISRSFSTRVEPTENVRACAAMFGIGVDEEHAVQIYKDLTIDVERGRIIYFTGESGAGKSCAMRDLMACVRDSETARAVSLPSVDQFPDTPLVDQFAGLGIKESLELLSFVGIAEAFVFLRKPRELSDGQRYRFILAHMIHEAQTSEDDRPPVIFVDEFLAFLDRTTAKNVAYQVRRLATKCGLCFVVATTHEDIAKDLQADDTIRFALNMPPLRL